MGDRRFSHAVLRAAAAGAAALALLAGCSAADVANTAAEHAVPARVSAIPHDEGAYVHGQLVIGLAAGEDYPTAAGVQGELENAGLAVKETLAREGDGFGAILLAEDAGAADSSGDDLRDAAEAAASIPGVEYVQPNYRYVSANVKATDMVLDPEAGKQYFLD